MTKALSAIQYSHIGYIPVTFLYGVTFVARNRGRQGDIVVMSLYPLSRLPFDVDRYENSYDVTSDVTFDQIIKAILL